MPKTEGGRLVFAVPRALQIECPTAAGRLGKVVERDRETVLADGAKLDLVHVTLFGLVQVLDADHLEGQRRVPNIRVFGGDQSAPILTQIESI